MKSKGSVTPTFGGGSSGRLFWGGDECSPKSPLVKEFFPSRAASQKHNYINDMWHFPAKHWLGGGAGTVRYYLGRKQRDN